MAWIKRNLILVVGGVIALALLVVAVLFLMDKLRQDAAATEELNAKTAAFKELLNRPVHPGSGKVNNIQAAKEDAKTLQEFLVKERQAFGPVLSTNKMNNKEFRALLDVTFDLLQRKAEESGVGLPEKDYWFTFAAQKTSVEFAPATVSPLAAQLADIRAICEILYKARVTGILSLKRVPTAKEDSGPSDYTHFQAVTNELAVLVPYEVTFQGFSTELEKVLEGLAAAPQFFVVKNVAADRASAPGGNTLAPSSEMVPNPAMRPLNPEQIQQMQAARRFGLPPPPAMVPGAVAPAPGRPGRGGLVTILDEMKLRFQLRVDVVRLKPAK